MVQVKNKINIDDFLVLIYWVKTHYLFEGKNFAYTYLLKQAQTYKYNNTPLDTNLHKIDDLVIDAFKVYHKLKETEEKVMNVIESIPLVSKEDALRETKRYENIFEDLMENYKFEDPEVRGIQKGVLNEKMKEYVAEEDYENAAKVRDMIKMC